ncbi:DEKNAAC103902 [Brettanomyces naardenensis]|uniref:DEKNAAC103902 n=1 Tax=Brettanomyces naardenensis TaxID=13370 RepID=A0A448YPL3_BRENA|nr:DEKNAAC103902 [Brettanomyces naardenensis]
MSGFWLRTSAAKTDKGLLIACSISSFVCTAVSTLAGLPGILALWTGDMQFGDADSYIAFYALCAKMQNWVIAVILFFVVASSTCIFD